MKKSDLIVLICGVSVSALLVFTGVRVYQLENAGGRGREELTGQADQIWAQLNSYLRGEDQTQACTYQSDLAETPVSETEDTGRIPETLSGVYDAAHPHEAGENVTEAQPLTETAEQSTGHIAAATADTLTVPEDHFVIFVGDSRTVGMARAEKQSEDACLYIGQSGEGLDWFLEDGLSQMEEAIETRPDAPVIYNLGVNDCDSIDEYLSVYQDLEKTHPQTHFYYMSVNPVTGESPHVHNEDILVFNRKLRRAFPNQYIDTFSWMVTDGFESADGVHYTEEQYCAIHDFAVNTAEAYENGIVLQTDAPVTDLSRLPEELRGQ